jgi:hypothetical protein
LRSFARPAAQALLAGLAGLALALALFGYSGGDNPQDFQFRPSLEAKLDPTLYPRDAFVETLKRVPSLFWDGCGAVSRETGLPPDVLFFGLYLASTVAVYSLIFALGLECGGSTRSGWFAVALTAISSHLHFYSLLAHDGMLRNHVDQTTLAWPLLLGSLWLWLRGRWDAAFALAGVAFDFNPFFGVDVAACLLMCQFAATEGRARLIRPLRGFAIFMAAGAPVWWSIVHLSPPAIASSKWAALLRLWYPYHYFPSAWPGPQWLYLLGHGGALAALYVSAFRRARPRPDMLRFGSSLLALWIGYVFFSEILPYRPFILFQALRLDTLATLLCLVGAAVVLDRLIESGPAGVAWAAVVWVGLANPHRTFFPLALLLPAAFEWAAGEGPFERSFESLRPYAAAVAIASAIWLIPGLHLVTLYPLESAALMAAFSAAAWRPGPRVRRALPAAFVAAVLIMFAECGVSQDIGRKVEAADANRLEREQVGTWLRTHTQKDALVLAAPYFLDLRLASGRSQVVQFIDGAAMHWAPDFGPEWEKRMEDVHYRFDLARKFSSEVYLDRFPLLERRRALFPLVGTWDAERQRRLLAVYKPDYVVMPYPPIPELKSVFRSGRFTVYRVEPASAN